MSKTNVDYHHFHQMERKQAKIRCLAFTSLFPYHLMIINIIFAHASLYVTVLLVGKICVLDLHGILLHAYSVLQFYTCSKIRLTENIISLTPSSNPNLIAVGDRILLGMQDFDFAQI